LPRALIDPLSDLNGLLCINLEVSMTGLEFIALVSQLATIARTAKEFLGKSRNELETELEQDVAKQRVSSELQEAIAKIDPEIREAYGRRIRKARDRYIDVINDPGARPYDWDEARDRAQYEICAVLKLIRKHNGDVLPEEVKDLWAEYSCDATRN
jgi:hypothetical protein